MELNYRIRPLDLDTFCLSLSLATVAFYLEIFWIGQERKRDRKVVQQLQVMHMVFNYFIIIMMR